MGKHRTIEEYIRQTAAKEKQKIKESVLEVFRTRSKSPGGNGAFLVAGTHSEIDRKKTHTTSPDKNSAFAGFGQKHLRKLYSAADRKDLEDNMSPTERNTRSRKRKMSKTKGARMKLHKTEETIDQAQAHSASNLRYALRSAQEQKEQHARNAISRIASNRMTKRLGLFNQGKKSETILRAYTSNGRQRTAEDDLQEFLSKSPTASRSNEPDRLSSHLLSNDRSKENEVVRVRSADVSGPETGYRSAPSTVHSITPASIQRASAPQSIRSLVSSCSSGGKEEHLPSLVETVDKVLSRIKPEIIFPDRVDFVQETTDELRRIMRINAPRSYTPTPLLRTCSSVKRSLLTGYPTPRKDKHLEQRPVLKHLTLSNADNSNPRKEVKDQEATLKKEPSNSQSMVFSSSPFDMGKRQFQPCFHDLTDIQSDAQTLLQCHDQVIAQAKRHTEQATITREEISLEDLYNADGLDILKKHDEQAKKLLNQGWRGDKENVEGKYWRKEERISWREKSKDWKRGKEGNFWSSQEGNNCRDREGDNWRDKGENSWANLFPEMPEARFSSQGSSMSSGYQGSQILRDTKNCKTEMIPTYSGPAQFSGFMPQFHDQEYYNGNHTSGMSSKIRSLDILEILDDTEAPHSHGSSRQENYSSYSNRLPHRDIIDNLNVDPDISSMQCGESTSQKRRSPQRASQEEYHFCLKKPSLDTPSPPDELFKKHSLIP